MKIKLRYLPIIFFLLGFLKVNAQNNIDALLRFAAENNPGLKARYNKYMADMQKVNQVGSLPDPDLSFGYFIEPMELIGGNQVAQIQFMQMFPWFGTLKASKDEASAMALSSYELFRAEKEDLFYNIRNNYYQLYYNQKQIQVYDTTLVLLKSIEQLLLSRTGINISGNASPVNTENQMSDKKSARANSQMGMNTNSQKSDQQGSSMNNQSMSGSGNGSAFSDLLRLQVEIRELESNMEFLKNRKQILTFQINTLLNRKSDIEVDIPANIDIPDFDFYNPALFDSVKANNPMIRMNKADILAYQQRQRMNKKMSYPMIGIGLNYAVINKSEMSTSAMNGSDMIMPMLTLKLPIYRKKYNATVKEALYLENAATEQLSNAENMLFIEFSEYLFGLKEADRKLGVYKDIISLTQNSFNILLIQYSSSASDLDALIRLHRQLLDYRLNIAQAQVDKLTAIAGLQKILSKN